MANLKDVRAVVADLHAKKIFNADISVTDLLAVQAEGLSSGAEKVGWYVLGGEHYVIVCGKDLPNIAGNPINIHK